jgi:thioredoxin 2
MVENNSNARHIVCPHCEAINRIPQSKPAREAKCGRCHKPLFSGTPVAATTKNFDRHIQRNDIPTVVDFRAEWCGPCKMMAPVFQRVAAELEPDVRFLEVDTEKEQELAARYAIRSIPTVMLFNKKSIVAQRPGAVDERTLRAWIREHLDGAAAKAQ